MQEICKLFGCSRAAHYKNEKKQAILVMDQAIVLKLVEEIREKLPWVGVIKLYYLLEKPLADHNIKMGRDKLYDLLGFYGLLIKKKRRRNPITTDSNHPFYRYKNLIKTLTLERPDQLWVSDITYIKLTGGFSYLSLVTDAYSRKIVGYYLNTNLSKEGPLKAMSMALLNSKRKRSSMLIHHSDRGLQYCCNEYVALLTDHRIGISMTENGDPYENALAERINGILKSEFNLGSSFKSIAEAQQVLDAAIKNYNDYRPHLSLNLLTPQQVHQTNKL